MIPEIQPLSQDLKTKVKSKVESKVKSSKDLESKVLLFRILVNTKYPSYHSMDPKLNHSYMVHQRSLLYAAVYVSSADT